MPRGLNLYPVRGIPADDLEAAGYGDRDALHRVEAVIQSWMPRLTDEGRPSTAQDVAKARRTEVDYINGAVCARAADVNVPVPCQLAITNLVKSVERAEVVPSIANIEGL